MTRVRRDEGAVTTEYTALLLLIAAIILALLLSGISPAFAEGLRRALCEIFQDQPCPPAGVPEAEPEPLNRMGLPCLTHRDALDMGVSVLVKGVQVDAGSGYSIEQLGTSRFRVTLYGQNQLGVGTKIGDGAGTVTDKEGQPGTRDWQRGKYGSASVTVGGRASTSYDFDTREEAEAFAEGQRGGWKNWVHTLGGVQGHLYTRGWEWLKGKVSGDEGPEPSFTSVNLNLRAGGEAGYNGGEIGGFVKGSGIASGVHTTIHLDDLNWTVFTASVDGSAGAGVFSRYFTIGGNVGGALRYRVIFNKDGQPLRFVLIREWGYTGGGSLTRARIRERGPDVGQGLGAGAGASHSKVFILEDNLDLRDPANRAAFDRAFAYVPGQVAIPRVEDEAAMGIFAGRMEQDAVQVDLDYREQAGSLFGGGAIIRKDQLGRGFIGAGRGFYGADFGMEDVNRDLVSATIVDPRWANPEPRRFESCWDDSGGVGVPSGVGSPGEGSGQ